MSDETSDLNTLCQQIVREGDDCCASRDVTCTQIATWERAEDGVRLCDRHMGNARTLGGVRLGYWVVGETKVPYPDGWTRIEDGAPLVDEVPAARELKPNNVDPKVRPSGLVLP
jgi:hypothetical protein